MKKQHAANDFQIFVKPVGALCNLHCSYCYYIGKLGKQRFREQWCMSDEVLEMYIRQHIEATYDPVVLFSWHGGEPLLAGIDFYKRAQALQHKYCPADKTVVNGIQTNG